MMTSTIRTYLFNSLLVTLGQCYVLSITTGAPPLSAAISCSPVSPTDSIISLILTLFIKPEPSYTGNMSPSVCRVSIV